MRPMRSALLRGGIGLLLVAESFQIHVPKSYIYFAMGYSVAIEAINIKIASKKKAKLAAEAAEHAA